MKRIPPIVIAVHSLLNADGSVVYGTGSSIPKFLHKAQLPWIRIQLPIYGGSPIRIEEEISKKLIRKEISEATSKSLTRKSWQELVVMLSMLKSLPSISVYIGIDPLNALFGILAKRMYKNIGNVVYYTADYAHKRFSNNVTNVMYHAIDRFVVHHADQVWNVSTKIYSLRASQGVSTHKNYFIPNTPLLEQIPKKNPLVKKNKFDMVIVGTSANTLDYEMLLKAIPKIVRKFPLVRLCIIGELHFSKEFSRTLDVYIATGRVVLLGKQNHSRVLKLLQRSGVGLAPYTTKSSWTEFGDSMKIREYLACGLPVVATRVVSTSEIITEFNCGKVIPSQVDSFVKALTSIWNKKNYITYTHNAKKAALAYDTSRMIKAPLLKLGINL